MVDDPPRRVVSFFFFFVYVLDGLAWKPRPPSYDWTISTSSVIDYFLLSLPFRSEKEGWQVNVRPPSTNPPDHALFFSVQVMSSQTLGYRVFILASPS